MKETVKCSIFGTKIFKKYNNIMAFSESKFNQIENLQQIHLE